MMLNLIGQITHGMSRTKEYGIWKQMIQRCKNPKNLGFKWYGGRGIKVCKRWHKFENFYEDMGDCPPGKSLDRRPDNDGDYELSNCKWSTPKEQADNCRSKSCGPFKQRWFFAYNENTGEWLEKDSQKELAKQYGLAGSAISRCLHKKQKIHKGWIFEFLT